MGPLWKEISIARGQKQFQINSKMDVVLSYIEDFFNSKRLGIFQIYVSNKILYIYPDLDFNLKPKRVKITNISYFHELNT